MPVVVKFDDARLEALCDVLGDTNEGLTGTEMSKLLYRCGIHDPRPDMSKRVRLFEALGQRQQRDGYGNKVAEFIEAAMNPVSYTGYSAHFESQRTKLNAVLAFCGMMLGENGKLRTASQANTLPEAEERAGRLRAELMRRKVHPDLLKFCRAELLQKDYFHAILEAAKSLAEKLRQRTGLTADGSALVDQALAPGQSNMPLLALNSLQTDTERSMHMGMMSLMKGTFSFFRNPPAHAPRILADKDEDDALEALSLMSLLHRLLDSTVDTPALRNRTTTSHGTPKPANQPIGVP